MKTTEFTHLEIMNRMSAEDNQGIRMQNEIFEVRFAEAGGIISFGVEKPIGEDAYYQHASDLPGKHMFMLFAVNTEELQSTRKRMNHEKNEISDSRMIDRFEQLHCARLANLYWLMCQFENDDLKEMLCEMSKEEFESCFPGILSNPLFTNIQNDKEEILYTLGECGFHGLIAEIEYPEMLEFTFRTVTDDDFTDESEYSSCSINPNKSRLGYIYAESKEELLAKMELQSVEMVKYWIAEAKSK